MLIICFAWRTKHFYRQCYATLKTEDFVQSKYSKHWKRLGHLDSEHSESEPCRLISRSSERVSKFWFLISPRPSFGGKLSVADEWGECSQVPSRIELDISWGLLGRYTEPTKTLPQNFFFKSKAHGRQGGWATRPFLAIYRRFSDYYVFVDRKIMIG